MTTNTSPTPYELARMAGCSDPDGVDSPGAQFLRDVWHAATRDRDAYADDVSDAAHDIADSAVPVYTRDVWATFTDLGAWAEDPSELGYDASDMEQAAKVCLYLIGQRLAGLLLMTSAEYEEAAAALGREHGAAGASWVFDGNTDPATYAECVRMDDDGDPEWFDWYGPQGGPLSGEWADGMTIGRLADELGLSDLVDPDVLDDLARVYEDAFDQGWHDEVMRVALYHVDIARADAEGEM